MGEWKEHLLELYIEDDPLFLNEEEVEAESCFLQRFISSTSNDKLYTIARAERDKFLLAYLSTIKKKETFSDLVNKTKHLKRLNSSDEKEEVAIEVAIRIVADMCRKFMENGLLEEASHIPLLSCKKGRIEEIVASHQEEYRKFYQAGLIDSLSMLHISLKKSFCDTEEGREAFFDLLKTYPEPFLQVMLVMSTPTINDIIQDKKTLEELAMSPSNQASKYLQNMLTAIAEHTQDLANETMDRIARTNSINKKIERIAKCFHTTRAIEIPPLLFQLLDNEKVKEDVIKKALLWNRKQYLPLQQQLLEKEKESKLERLLNNSIFSGRTFSEKELELLTQKGNLDTIAKILSIFDNEKDRFFAREDFPITDILLLSSPTIVSNVHKAFLQDFISAEFLLKNPSVFVDEIPEELSFDVSISSSKAKNFLTDLSLLRERKADTKSLSMQNPQILLKDPLSLERNLKILDSYEIHYEKAKVLSMATEPYLISYLDQFIEFGLSTYVRNHPDIIDSNSFTLIRRAMLCKQLGLPIIDKKKLSSLLSKDTFQIGSITIRDEEILNYLEFPTFLYANEEIFQILCANQNQESDVSSDIELLKSYQKNDQVYNIHGVIISKRRVLRNYQALQTCDIPISEEEKVFQAILFGSMYQEEELKTLENTLLKPAIGKVKKIKKICLMM